MQSSIIHTPLHCDLGPGYRGTVAMIGNMDGVHLGHQSLIKETIKYAKLAKKPVSALVFEPHPRIVFQAEAPPFLLTDLTTKAQLLQSFGVDIVMVLPFIEDFYCQTPHEFVHTTLKQRLGVSGIVTGTDFHFGAARSGNVDVLHALAKDADIDAHALSPLLVSSDDKYSSSTIRDALREGDLKTARAHLGRDWLIRGTVHEGKKLARQLGFPTANIVLGDYLRPKFGVYVISAQTPFGTQRGVANIGTRPTVDGVTELLEIHLFDFDDDLYGAELDVTLHKFLRPEKKFDGLEALKAQIAQDKISALQWHNAR